MTCEPNWLLWGGVALNVAAAVLWMTLFVLTHRERWRINRQRLEALSDLQDMLDRHAERTPR